ncbi:MAG: amidohydrolase family protein [Phycisphaeraceae bacterium]|nr:amidohydrolase family protein [Phycisphaerales bacterium]MCB9859459.1 amidohydrolase family protein [Phycisphaeraceae bacterium]
MKNATQIVRTLVGVALGALATTAHAQDLGVKAPPQKEPIIVYGATVHTVSNGIIENGYVRFENGRITGVGSVVDIPEPQNAPGSPRVIRGQNLHVYPGLISSVTQLGLTEHGQVAATVDSRETGNIKPEVRAIAAVNPDSTLLPVTRSNGILTVGVFPVGGTVAGRMGVMSLDGWTWEDMALDQTAGLVINWPNMLSVRAPWMNQSEGDQANQRQQRINTIDAMFDQAIAYRAARKADPTQREDIGLEAMQAFIPGENGEAPAKPVFLFAQELEQITTAVSWAIEKGVRPVIVGGRDAPLCAELLKANNVGVIIEGTLKNPRRDDSPYDEPYKLPLALQDAGIHWALASGEEPAHDRNLPYHAGKAIAFGLNEDDAIRAMTLSAAQLLGVDARIGSIEAGKDATLIVTDGTPVEIATRTLHAFIGGREIDLRNKQTELADKYREKYRQLNGR